MANSLVIAEGLWRELRGHLLADDEEHVAFLLVKPAGDRLLVRDVLLIPDEDLIGHGDAVSLKLSALLDAINLAVRRGLALVEAHSHPLAVEQVDFSLVDERGQGEMVSYLADVIPGQPYGALVLGQRAARAKVWRGENGATSIDKLVVTGAVLEQWPGDGRPRAAGEETTPLGDGRHDRQVLAIGEVGHARVAGTRVAVVGLGGVGSIVALELAHLGVQEIILIDDDRVEVSNLNRLAGATPADVGRPKVSVAEEQVLRVNPAASVTALQANVRDRPALEAIGTADVVFGCVDTDSGRLILNELAVAYLMPYIDCGVGIAVLADAIDEAGGRVIVWVPGRPCLLCCREIDRAIAGEELESAEEQAFRRQHGYVAGAMVPEPAVMSLNGTIASLAVTEFLAIIAGIRSSQHYIYYDMLEQRVGPRLVRRAPGCVGCAVEGIGDEAGLERFSRGGLPTDVPALDSRRATGS